LVVPSQQAFRPNWLIRASTVLSYENQCLPE
jgi:hypothetical protein